MEDKREASAGATPAATTRGGVKPPPPLAAAAADAKAGQHEHAVDTAEVAKLQREAVEKETAVAALKQRLREQLSNTEDQQRAGAPSSFFVNGSSDRIPFAQLATMDANEVARATANATPMHKQSQSLPTPSSHPQASSASSYHQQFPHQQQQQEHLGALVGALGGLQHGLASTLGHMGAHENADVAAIRAELHDKQARARGSSLSSLLFSCTAPPRVSAPQKAMRRVEKNLPEISGSFFSTNPNI
jgi:hypothetical protein